MTFSPSNPGTGFAIGMVELVAVDQAPLNPAFTHFCTDTNGLCVTSQYTLNYAGTATTNTGNLAIVSGTAYCSGLTSSSITTGATRIQGWATFGGNDRNVTGATMLVQLYITTIAPSTAFAAGQCSASQFLIGTSTIVFASIGTGASNAYTVTVTGNLGVIAGTWYSYVEVTPYNFGTAGHLLWLSSLGQAYSFGTIGIMEIK
jgi:hypothetical protein